MPFVQMTTNVDLGSNGEREMAGKFSRLAAELAGKPETFVMVNVEGGRNLLFGGSDEPAAYVRFESIGLPQEQCPSYSADICAFLEAELSIDPGRVYIDFKSLDASMFGWSSKTFR